MRVALFLYRAIGCTLPQRTRHLGLRASSPRIDHSRKRRRLRLGGSLARALLQEKSTGKVPLIFFPERTVAETEQSSHELK